MLPQFRFRYTLLSCLVFLCATLCTWAQNVSPFQGLGVAQFFDNNGQPLTAGVLYSYQAGTTTQLGTYTDSTGTILNPNPLPFTSGARVSIWLLSGSYYKLVLCSQNDGAFCAPGDVLFSVDQVPGNPAGVVSGNTFTGTFISSSANPATTGILRLATGDAICWRNQANTANLCISKDTSDVLSWGGSAMKFTEAACSNAGIALDYLCADASTHHWKFTGNGSAQFILPGLATAAAAQNFASFAANLIDITDSGVSTTNPSFTTVTIAGAKISGAPTTGQCLIAPDATDWNPAACPPSMNPPQRVVLGSPVSMSASVQTTILTESVTFPAGPGTYRAQVSYGVYITAGSNACVAEVIDATNNLPFALSGQNSNGTGFLALNGAEVSAGTYSANAIAVFRLVAECNNGAGGLVGATVHSGLFTLSPNPTSFLSVTPVLTN